MSDEQVRAIHAAYVRGDGSIDKLVEAIGCKPARTPAHAEQRMITALLLARVDELRKPRALSLERLAHASDVSIWTLHQLRNQLSDPRLTTVLRLCYGLGVTTAELVGDLPLPVEARPRSARKPVHRRSVHGRADTP